MTIDNAFNEVFQRDKKIFIPDFAALIYSEFNDGIDINELLNFDDGKITTEIQKQESISEEEASKMLQEYVKNLKANLEEKGTHFIGGIGYINKGEDGALTVAASISEPVFLDEDASDSVDSEKGLITKKTQNIDDSIPEVENRPDEQNDSIAETSVEQDVETKEEVINSEEEQSVAGEHKNEKALEADENSEESYDQEESTEPVYSFQAEDTESYQVNQEEYESSKNRKRPILIAVAVILLLAVIAVPLYFFAIKTDSQNSKTISASALAERELQSKIEPGLEKEEVIPEENESILNAEKEPNESSGNVSPEPEFGANKDNQKVYSLILGSFKIEKNADQFKQYLGEKGLKVSKFHRNNSFYFVGIEQIKGKPNAVKLLAELREEEEPTAWIIKKL